MLRNIHGIDKAMLPVTSNSRSDLFVARKQVLLSRQNLYAGGQLYRTDERCSLLNFHSCEFAPLSVW